MDGCECLLDEALAPQHSGFGGTPVKVLTMPFPEALPDQWGISVSGCGCLPHL
jgi:hypothetical protein